MIHNLFVGLRPEAPKYLRSLEPTPEGRHYSGISGTGSRSYGKFRRANCGSHLTHR